MALPQTGIFALGTASHTFLEFDLVDGAHPKDLITAAANISDGRTTMGAVNLVIGLRPELWNEVVPDSLPSEVTSFEEPVVGSDGFRMPATQRDLAIWIAGASYDIVFDKANELIDELASVVEVITATEGWVYHRDLDLTGFVDGKENPTLATAAPEVTIPDGQPGAGGSVLLLQKWQHQFKAWNALPVKEQEAAMGRTKEGSIELDPRPETSHVARTDQDTFGHILRRNTAYGTIEDQGTMFVGFSQTRKVLHTMLESMAGVDNGPRDELTRYTTALTGSYYFCPAIDALVAHATEVDDD